MSGSTCEEYFHKLQVKALQLQTLLTAMSACLDDPDRRDVVAGLILATEEIAKELNIGLDSLHISALGEVAA